MLPKYNATGNGYNKHLTSIFGKIRKQASSEKYILDIRAAFKLCRAIQSPK